MKMSDDGDDDGGGPSASNSDLFEQALNKQAGSGGSRTGHRSTVAQYRVLQLDERTLLSLQPNEVFIVKYPTPARRNQYYKNMIPEIKIHLSPHCRRFFHEDDFELEYLKHGHCPCCRVTELDAPDQDGDTGEGSATATKDSGSSKRG